MWLPPQTPPVRRPDLVAPHTCVDLTHGTPGQLISIRMELMHGANFNDPPYWALPSYARLRLSAGAWHG